MAAMLLNSPTLCRDVASGEARSSSTFARGRCSHEPHVCVKLSSPRPRVSVLRRRKRHAQTRSHGANDEQQPTGGAEKFQNRHHTTKRNPASNLPLIPDENVMQDAVEASRYSQAVFRRLHPTWRRCTALKNAGCACKWLRKTGQLPIRGQDRGTRPTLDPLSDAAMTRRACRICIDL